MSRDSFVFYISFYNAICELPTDMQINLYNAIMRYSFFNEAPELDAVSRAIFKLIRPQIDANNVKYENGCKGGQFGKRGGAPKGNQNARKQPQNNPKTTRNDNVNVNDNVNDNVCVTAHAKEFCTKYGIAVDTPKDTHTENLDFRALDTAYSKSSKFLQKCASSLRLSWIVKNYDTILSGKFDDCVADKKQKSISEEWDDYYKSKNMTADEINAAFLDLNEDL